MIKSILTTALRNILRNRTFSIINMAGLSVSMSLALLVILLVKEQYSYDDFHRDADRIHRVNTRALRTDGGSEDYASTPLPIGHVFKEDYSFAEAVVGVNRQFEGDVLFGNVNVPVTGLLVDPEFLTVFNFPLEKGNPALALSEPNGLVLTRHAARRIFGDREAIGQTVTVSGYGEFIITGVLKEFESKTHFEFEMLGSMTALPALEQSGTLQKSRDDWNNYYSNYVYFKLRDGRGIDEAQAALDVIAKKYYEGLPLETRDRGYAFFTVPLDEITPGVMMSNQMGTGMPVTLIVFLSVLVGIVMLIACFNYTNLMIAKSLSRAREIGVRKVVGAQRFQVFLQFIGEAVVFALICLSFSYFLLKLVKPAFKELNMALEMDAVLEEDYVLYLYFFAFAVVAGIVAGLLPAAYLSALRPARVLKDSGGLKLYSRLTFRKVLIVTQFTLSIAFIIVVLVIYRQINFMVTKDYGVNEKNILNIRLQGTAFDKLANEVRALPGVIRVGAVSHRLGTWDDGASDYRRNAVDEPFVMRDFMVDDNYITNLDLEFLAGGNFDPEEQGVREKHVILNEEALRMFRFSDPVSAIGQPIYTDDSLMLTVIGVAKNFHFRPLSYQIGPLALRYNPASARYVSAMIAPSRKEEVLAAVAGIWKKVDPAHPLEWRMMEDQIDDAYTQAGLLDMLNIVGYISFVAVTLACLGILGMAMYSTQTRVKEIGVRKVMGATSGQVTLLLSRSFLILIAIAACAATPIGYFFGTLFLDGFVYKIDVGAVLVLEAILVVAVLGILTISSQTWKAASANPVKSLRYE